MAKIDDQINKAKQTVLLAEEKYKKEKQRLVELEQQKEEIELKEILFVTKKKGLALTAVKQLLESHPNYKETKEEELNVKEEREIIKE